ncbi:hypothetical protein SGODD07_01700 [Streptococcus gordonii]|uniref:Uncharacterized protein n=1 Tax=Streptococcus gordonii TaxID=1302 RepID=A0A139N1I6_STRGN|nr:hypothetical protein SGODD07_01700 [Streptococcus gordonii]
MWHDFSSLIFDFILAKCKWNGKKMEAVKTFHFIPLKPLFL